MSTNGRRLRFGDFELDLQSTRLLRHGRPVKIQPQPLRVLIVLAERAGEVVSREDLRALIWDTATFVEFDQGLNYGIRQIRLALSDDAANPTYVETVKKQGYRFIAAVQADEPAPAAAPAAAPLPPVVQRPSRIRRAWWLLVAGLSIAIAAGVWLYERSAAAFHPSRVSGPVVQQITDFADSAMAPALSPDGRMVAFIRGASDFLTPDQIYVKMLPAGEATRLTDDPRMKYGVTFSPDGSDVAYTVMENSGWATYEAPVLGGEPRLVLANAAGLTWLDPHQLLFSEIRGGQHMGIVTSPDTRANPRELYFPTHERAMAHYAFAAPNRHSAIVVEMDKDGAWQPCRLISLDGGFQSRTVGPRSSCRSAGWSPDGQSMYFTAAVGGHYHLWRQRSEDGTPEQLTFGPTDELGVAVDPGGRSIITSIGARASTMWIHTADGDRQLSFEGQIAGVGPYTSDGQFVYYLLRLESAGSNNELRRMSLSNGHSTELLPGVPVIEFDVSPDGRQLVYSTSTGDGSTQLWIAPMDRSAPPQPVGAHGERSPMFGPSGEILFRFTEGTFNYLGRMNADGSGRARVVPYPISEIQAISPGRHWVMAIAPLLDNSTVAPMAIPIAGGNPIRVCEIYCQMAWSASGQFLFVSVEEDSLTGPGRSLAIPAGPGESLPAFPPLGVRPFSEAGVIAGARSVKHAGLLPGADLDTYVFVRSGVHRNLFRVVLPD